MENNKYNFNDIDFQIQLNKDRLEEERNRLSNYKNRFPIIMLLYTIFAGFTIQLVCFGFLDGYIWKWYFGIPLVAFLSLFLLSVIFSILLFKPQKIAYLHLPPYFYNDLKQQYKIQNDIPAEHINNYVKASYKRHLEESVKLTFETCNKKSRYHYWSLILALIALLPYMICVGIKVMKSPEEVIKIEIVQPKNQNIMIEDTNPTAESGNTPETDYDNLVDPSKVIYVAPVMISDALHFNDIEETKWSKADLSTEDDGTEGK
jgi:hypothetical protein